MKKEYSKEVEQALKIFRAEGMKDPEERALHNLAEIEPATLSELARKHGESKAKTLGRILPLIDNGIISLTQTSYKKLIKDK